MPKMPKEKFFTLKAILSLVTHQMIDDKSYKEMKGIINFMAGETESISRHKTNAKCRTNIYNQYPELMDVDAQKLIALLWNHSKEEKVKAIKEWYQKLEKRFGKRLKIRELADKKPSPYR